MQNIYPACTEKIKNGELKAEVSILCICIYTYVYIFTYVYNIKDQIHMYVCVYIIYTHICMLINIEI